MVVWVVGQGRGGEALKNTSKSETEMQEGVFEGMTRVRGGDLGSVDFSKVLS